MATTNSAQLQFEYDDGATRNITFDQVSDSALETYKARVLALNTTIADSIAGAAYKETFVSDDGAPIKRIRSAKYTVTEEQVIYNG